MTFAVVLTDNVFEVASLSPAWDCACLHNASYIGAVYPDGREFKRGVRVTVASRYTAVQ